MSCKKKNTRPSSIDDRRAVRRAIDMMPDAGADSVLVAAAGLLVADKLDRVIAAQREAQQWAFRILDVLLKQHGHTVCELTRRIPGDEATGYTCGGCRLVVPDVGITGFCYACEAKYERDVPSDINPGREDDGL